MGNLVDVQEQLRADYEALEGRLPPAPSEALVLVAEKMPLSHRAGKALPLLKEIVADTAALRPGPGDPVRQQIGTDDCAFTWLGPSRYLAPAVVLFFREGFDERNSASCLIAPWDTKGTLRHGVLGRRLEPADAAELVARYSLPPTEAHRFLADVLACCHQRPSGYVDGQRPLACYPGRNSLPFTKSASYEETPAYTFEARFASGAAIAGEIDSIVLNPFTLWSSTLNRELQVLKRWCRQNEVTLQLVEADEAMQQAVVRETQELLRKRGAQ